MAHATALDCTFTTICSPLTECQIHPGVPFRFEQIEGTLTLDTATDRLEGTVLSHVHDTGLAVIFADPPDSTILLSVASDGTAVLTQQDLPATGVQSVSYFGTCEPAA